MGMSDYLLWLHSKATTAGTVIGQSGDEYSEDEVDFEIAAPGVEKSGNFGLHIVVQEDFATMVDNNVWIVTGAATAPTTKLIGRYFVLADLVAGKHYLIPCPPGGMLRYARALWDVVETNPTAGKVSMYFGPRTGGEL
jgi:hypothetical protein